MSAAPDPRSSYVEILNRVDEKVWQMIGLDIDQVILAAAEHVRAKSIIKEYKAFLVDNEQGREYALGLILKSRVDAVRYGVQQVKHVQLHDRWSFRLEERDVTSWTPSSDPTEEEINHPAVTRRMT
jgi:hypothetical protein